MQAATCFIVFLTVVFMGGTTPFMLRFFDVRTGVTLDEMDEEDSLSMKTWHLLNDYFVRPCFCRVPDGTRTRRATRAAAWRCTWTCSAARGSAWWAVC